MNKSSPAKILVIDDQPANLDILLRQLNRVGYKVYTTTDGFSGLEMAKTEQPDLILLDVMMPEIDGFQVCRRLKQDKATAKIPVIFMTALSDVDSKIKGFELGGVDYVTKPLELREVYIRINSHLRIDKLRRDLETRNRELDAFAHMVAHDLKGQVNAILGWKNMLEYIINNNRPEKVSSALEGLEDTTLNMKQIIEEMLLLASIKSAQVTLKSLDMHSLVESVVSRTTHLVTEFEAQVELSERWPQAMGYAPWIESVWSNYLSNAIKYGGTPPHVKLGATVDEPNKLVKFWVQDNGPGLTEEEQMELFIPFRRLEHVGVEGTGLGLSIVQRIMKRLGGTYGVESEPGAGSRFSFSLPMAAQQNAD